jgi:hypothetical protein
LLEVLQGHCNLYKRDEASDGVAECLCDAMPMRGRGLFMLTTAAMMFGELSGHAN